jgi:hypothetical protein
LGEQGKQLIQEIEDKIGVVRELMDYLVDNHGEFFDDSLHMG